MLNNLIKTFAMTELRKGLGLTFRHLFARKITVQYPEEKAPARSDV
jgi:NADH-quinone oxidoreductase subunit I